MHTTDSERHDLIHRLRAAGCVFAEDEAELLIAEASSASELSSMSDRRLAGQPLEHIVGWVDFCGLRVAVDPGVFVPRQRTAVLAELAVEFARASSRSRPGAIVVDLCCGSGAIGAVVASRLGDVALYAADVDPIAVACARRNLEPLGGQVFAGDLFAAIPHGLRGRIGVLTANTPYVPQAEIANMPPEARLHEAAIALDGGGDGLDVQRALGADVTRWLAPGGHLLVETSAAQAPAAAEIFTAAGLDSSIHHDPERGGTVVISRRVSA